MLDRIWPEGRLAQEWPHLIATLRPAIGNYPVWPVLDRLMAGHMQVWAIPGAGFVVTKTAYVKGTETPCLWIDYAAGRLLGGRDWMALVLADLEGIARGFGCKEIRVESTRAKQWPLPGFEFLERRGATTILRKVL